MIRKSSTVGVKTGSTKTTKVNSKDKSEEPNMGIRPSLNMLYQNKLEIKHKNETQKQLSNSIKKNYFTMCTGPAGTGKTYIACLQALNELKNNEDIQKIVLVKSVTTLKDEEIGFLKGDMKEKMEPFMYSFTGNFEKIIGERIFEKLKEDRYVQILPIAYLRGVNIDNALVIIDEVQNISIENIRTIMTRLGEKSKMVFLGDVKQIDVKNKYNSALKFIMEHFQNVDGIGVVEFTKEDIIRHPLIKVVEDIFDKVLGSKDYNKIVPKSKTPPEEEETVVEESKFNFKNLINKGKNLL